MKKKSLYHGNRQMIVALLTFVFLLGPGFTLLAQEQDPIKHEVAVKRMLIPVFAYDKKGKNPQHPGAAISPISNAWTHKVTQNVHFRFLR